MSIFQPLNLDLNEQVGIPHVEAPRRPLLEKDLSGGEHDFILRIDNSTLEHFQACSKAARYYCVDRRQSIPSAALTYGGGIHLGLEILYREGFSALPEAKRICSEYIVKTGIANTPDEWRTPALAEDTLDKYVAHWTKEGDHITPIVYKGHRFLEQPFSLVLGEIQIDSILPFTYAKLSSIDSNEPMYIGKLTILWSGRIDIAANYGDAHIYVVDHKTSSIGGPQFFLDFILSQQMVGYNWALRKLLPDERIVGTVVNAIIGRKPTKTGRALDFERQTYFHTDWHVAEWENDVMQHIEHFVYSLTTNHFPKCTKWCFGKYGKCPYHDVCTLPPAQRHIMLDSPDYTNVTWSPLDDRI